MPKKIATLMSGTIVAQVIPVAISPILTRIYSPEDFGALALYVAILSIVSVLATMRYELAIVQPETDEEAGFLLQLSLLICGALSIVFLILVFAYNLLDLKFFNDSQIDHLLYLLPLSFLLHGVVQSFRYWLLRKSRYGRLSGFAITQSSVAAAGQVSTGLGGIPNGLVFGQLLGHFISAVYMFLAISKSAKNALVGKSRLDIKRVAVEYSNMPKYSILGGLSDNISVQLPVLVISRAFGSGVTGYFSLTFRVLNLPLVALSRALSQVLFKSISDIRLSDPKKVKPLVIKINGILILLMLPFVTFFWLWGEEVFSVVFGESWAQAGQMASLLVIAVAARFTVSPLSIVLAMRENVKLGMYWQLLYLLTLSITLAVFYHDNIEVMLIAFVCHEVVLYFIYFLIILKGSERLGGGSESCAE